MNLIKNPIFYSLLFFITSAPILFAQNNSMVVFSKTAGFRHDAIETGIDFLKKIAVEKQMNVVATEDASYFTEQNLQNHQLVVFLNTTGDVLNKSQQAAFERFIQAGGGFLGVHSATDTEYSWPWYNDLVGAYFLSHPNRPNVRTAQFDKVDKDNHISTRHMPARFEITDEFYNFKSLKLDLIKPLIKIDETTYEGGANGDNHPMSWYHEFDGGKAFYTALGHTKEMYTNPLFVEHIKGAIDYLLNSGSPGKLDYSKARSKLVPEANRFNKVTLSTGLDEPVELAVLPDERVLFVERKGAVKLYDPKTNSTKQIYQLEVSRRYKFKDNASGEAEDGLLGLALDPNFDKNGWFYMYFSLPGDKHVNVLTRWDFNPDTLNPASMKTVLEVAVQREQCCHTGGSITFDNKGNLYLSTGDNTSPRATRFAPLDERPGRFPWDSQKGSANTNDLRGKILRIKPTPEGGYTIPEGNLFPVGMEKTRPEIYGMGMRNPYRISVDNETGYVYWGDVGPDASRDSVGRGPAGYDEVNQMRKPGFFGWPYFIGENKAYSEYDFETNKSLGTFDPEKPINNSLNNTGLQELPPAQPAFISYSYDASQKFPLVGAGGRTAMAGPVYHYELYKDNENAFPEYFDDKLFIYEWIRDWIMVVSMDKEGNYVDMEPFMPAEKFSHPSDIELGPKGELYILEYGDGWFQKNEEAKLVKITFAPGNRAPYVKMKSSKMEGAIPLKVDVSSAGTEDYDGDLMTYEWKLFSPDGVLLQKSAKKDESFILNGIGNFKIQLTVTDTKGAANSSFLEVAAGNEPPMVDLDIVEGNKTFFFPDKPFAYEVIARDKEDGKNLVEDVAVTVDFLKEGFDKEEIASGHAAADEFTKFTVGKKLVDGSDCKSCHKPNAKSIGPSYVEVAKKYKDVAESQTYIAKKIKNGGSGVWGSVAMAAHPGFSDDDAGKIAEYILSLADQPLNRPMKGTYKVDSKEIVAGQGSVILRAAYTDKGANGMPQLKSQKIITLQSPRFNATNATDLKDVNKMNFGGGIMMGSKDGAWFKFDDLEMTGVNAIAFQASAPKNFGFHGGYLEIRLDGPDGKLLGKSENVVAAKVNPAAATNSNARREAPMINVPIEKLSGKKDLYFVFKSLPDQEAGNLFTVVDVELKAGK